MNISGASYLDSLAIMASDMKSENIGLQLSTTILKKTLDLQAQQGQALVAMISQSPSLDGSGQMIDIRA